MKEKTFPYKLLLDEREVSYPDAKEADDGFIYVTYDRERGSYLSNMKEVNGFRQRNFNCQKLNKKRILLADLLQTQIVI